MSDYSKLRLGFIGAGNMPKAIVQGILESGLLSPSQIYMSHPSATEHKTYAHLGIQNELADNIRLVKECDVIVLGVKPQMMEKVCLEVRDSLDSKRHLIVSIAAGIKLQKLRELLNNESNLRLVRCTLNTAALVGSSCSAYSHSGNLTETDKAFVESLLSSIGISVGCIKEDDMNPAMAVSSSGIAYVYMMADAMADAGVKMGLTRELALKLSMQTIKGAGDIMLTELGKKHPMQLKDEVCSPGGMTIQGVHELERNGFRNSVISAIESATNRAKQF